MRLSCAAGAVAPNGQLLASASYPGQGEILGAPLPLITAATLPLDRHLAPGAVAATGLLLLFLLATQLRRRRAAGG